MNNKKTEFTTTVQVNEPNANITKFNNFIIILNAFITNKQRQNISDSINKLVYYSSFSLLKEKEDELNDFESIYQYNSFVYLIKSVTIIFEVNKRECLLHFYRKVLIYDKFLIIKYNKDYRYIHKHLAVRNAYLGYIGFHCFKRFIISVFLMKWFVIARKEIIKQEHYFQSKLINIINKAIIREYNRKNITTAVYIINKGIVSKIIHNEINRLLKLYGGVNIIFKVLSTATIIKTKKAEFMSMIMVNNTNGDQNDNNYILYLFFNNILNHYHYSISPKVQQDIQIFIQNVLLYSKLNDNRKDNCIFFIDNQSYSNSKLYKVIAKHMIPLSSINVSLYKPFDQWVKISLFKRKSQLNNDFILLNKRKRNAKLYILSTIINTQRANLFHYFIYRAKDFNKKEYGFGLLLYLENKCNNKMLNVLSGIFKMSEITYRKYYPIKISPFAKRNKSFSVSFFVIYFFHKWKYMNYNIQKDTNMRLVYHMLIRAIHIRYSLTIMKYRTMLINKTKQISYYKKTLGNKINLFANSIIEVIDINHLKYKRLFFSYINSRKIILKKRNIILAYILNSINVSFIQQCYNQFKYSCLDCHKSSIFFKTKLFSIKALSKIVNILKSILIYKHFRLFTYSISTQFNNKYFNKLMLFNSLIVKKSFKFNHRRRLIYKWLSYVYSIRKDYKKEIKTLHQVKIDLKEKIEDYIEAINLLKIKSDAILKNKNKCHQCVNILTSCDNLIQPNSEFNKTLSSVISEESLSLKPIKNIKVKNEEKEVIEPILNENQINGNNINCISIINSNIQQYNSQKDNEIEYNLLNLYSQFNSIKLNKSNSENNCNDSNDEYYSYLEHQEIELKEKIMALNGRYESEIELIQNEIDSLYEEINTYVDANDSMQ